MKPRRTTSTGKTLQRRMMETLGWGTFRRALGMRCCVFCIHQALVRFSTCPCASQEHLLCKSADSMKHAVKPADFAIL